MPMQVDWKKKLVKKVYTIHDIIGVTIEVAERYWPQCQDIAKQLEGSTEYETCKNINDYVTNNVLYKEDGGTHQYVKTPARLLAEASGDCKSYAVFIASCLGVLGIPCKFRFVAWSGRDLKHVYIVTDSGINIDPVEVQINKKQFNEVSPYTYKKDIRMDYGLAILSGVDKDAHERIEVFMNGTYFLDNTRAANYLYSCIDLQWELIKSDPNNLQAQNAIDAYMCAAVLNAHATGYTELQKRAANILQLLANEGYFSLNSSDEDVRTENYNNFTSRALDLLASDTVIANQAGRWLDWYMLEVANNDYNSITPAERRLAETFGTDSVGAVGLNKLADDIKASGPVMLYALANSSTIDQLAKVSPVIRNKRVLQLNAIEAVKNSTISYFTGSTVENYMIAGVVAETGKTPEECMQEVVSGNKLGAVTFLGVVMIILEVLAYAVPIAAGVLAFCQSLNASESAKLQAALDGLEDETVQPSENDYNFGATSTTTNTASLGVFAAIAAAALLLFNKK